MNPLVRLDTSEDTPQILQAIHQTWLGKEPPDPDDARQVRDGFAYYYENFSEYTSGKIGLAEIDGEIASVAGIIPFPVGSGSFHPQAAQLNPVGTRREFRKRGLASACIRLLCEHLKEQGCSLFFVAGVSWFYPKLGFYPAFDEYSASCPISRLREISPSASVRPFIDADAAQFLHVYENAPHQNLLHLQRDEHWIKKKILERDDLPLGTIQRDDLLLSVRDSVATGYAVLKRDESALTLQELRAFDRDSLLALLKAAAAIGTPLVIDELTIQHAIPGEAIQPLALELDGRATVTHPSYLMLKILSVEKLFTAMLPLFRERVARSSWIGIPFTLTVESHGETVTLSSSEEGEFSVHSAPNPNESLTIPDPALVQLFTGHRTIEELADSDACPSFNLDKIDLLSVLFPRHYPIFSRRTIISAARRK
jgi:predicted acetyltransferase